MISVSGRFYRIVFENQLSLLLLPASNPEGRFHHDGQQAIYLSPTRQAAAVAIDSYYRDDDPPRLIVPISVDAPRILDFRKSATSETFALRGDETVADWRNERSAGRSASSWIASDAARAAGAPGMIYPSRKSPPNWHLVLFRWNDAGDATLKRDGPAQPFTVG